MNYNFNFKCTDANNFNTFAKILNCTNRPSFFHLNAQRVPNLSKFDALAEYLASLAQKPEVLSIVETWFLPDETGESSNSRNPISMFTMHGYKGIFSSRDCVFGIRGQTVRSGGIAVYVRDDIPFNVIEKSNGCVSYIHIELFPTGLKQKVFFTSIYMPKVTDYLSLFETLERLFLNVAGRDHLIMGDLNIDKLLDGTIQRDYDSLLRSFGYEISNDNVTRPASSSIIDHAICNFTGTSIATVETDDLSDHNALLVFAPERLCRNDKSTASIPKTTKVINYARLKQLLEALDSSYFYSLHPDDAMSELVQKVTSFVQQSTTLKKVSCKDVTLRPWLKNSFLLRLCRRKKSLLRKKKRFETLNVPVNPELLHELQDLSLRIKTLKEDLCKSYYF